MNPSTRTEVARLADQLERSIYGGAWQGPALIEALAGVDLAAATRRPVAGAHTIHEIVEHVTFWLHGARLRLAGGGPADEEDWQTSELRTEEAWHEAIAALERAHRELRATLDAMDDVRLDDGVAGSDPTARGLLLGLLQHNAYHAGQLVLLARAVTEDAR